MKRLAFVLVFVCAVAPLSAQKSPKKLKSARTAAAGTTRSQPVAERAAIRLLQQATSKRNAVLFVQFVAGHAPGPVTLGDGEDSATLRDDGVAPDEKRGDGIHSGYVLVDAKQLQARQDRMLSAKSLPLFVSRELVGNATAKLTSAKLTMNDLPAIPNRATFRPTNDNSNLSLLLPLAPVSTNLLIPIYPNFDLGLVGNDGRSLFITNPDVVADPKRTRDPCQPLPMSQTGKWTFGHLMSEMADGAGIDPSDFAQKWIDKWLSPQTVNTFTVPSRQLVRTILARWPKDAGKLRIYESPFKLVAIVNRIDLRGNLAYGSDDYGAGEARFVFAAIDTTDKENCPPPLGPPFLVIFEYKVNVSGCVAVKKWAKQWKDLEGLRGEAYNAALEAITVQFTEAGTNPSQLPNQSSLGQIRTNAFLNESQDLAPWEMREFRLVSTRLPGPSLPFAGHLFEDTVKQTPDMSFNDTTTLADYANANSADIVEDKHVVPKSLSGQPFLAGYAPLPGNKRSANAVPQFFWNGPAITTNSVRHHLSLNTCNGCHGQETGTVFMHVDPFGKLSTFLTGTGIGGVQDPAAKLVFHRFNDLARRRQILEDILTASCFSKYALTDVFFDPLRTTH